jgi:hypothetical protein
MGSISYTCEALSDLKGQKQVVEAVVHTAHKMGVAPCKYNLSLFI